MLAWRGFVAATVALAMTAAPAAAQSEGKVEEIEVPAPALEGNLVDTPSVQRALVYLPPSYETAEGRRYPTIYLLHGIFDSAQTWIDFAAAPAAMDALIAEGAAPEAILVMVDGGNRYGGGYYRNSPVTGDWADFIADDLVSAIDQRYRTLARPAGRAIVGHSMGGYGALHLAMERPGEFSAVYAMSPCCLAPVEDIGFGNVAWTRAFALKTSEDVVAALQAGDFYPVAMIGLLSAFRPDPSAAPLFVDFPFEIERGEMLIEPSAYAQYVASFPVERADEGREALAGLRLLAMDVGVRDQFQHILPATAAFSQRLSELRVPHSLEVYDGDHREDVRDRLRTIVLPLVAKALDRPE